MILVKTETLHHPTRAERRRGEEVCKVESLDVNRLLEEPPHAEGVSLFMFIHKRSGGEPL